MFVVMQEDTTPTQTGKVLAGTECPVQLEASWLSRQLKRTNFAALTTPVGSMEDIPLQVRGKSVAQSTSKAVEAIQKPNLTVSKS